MSVKSDNSFLYCETKNQHPCKSARGSTQHISPLLHIARCLYFCCCSLLTTYTSLFTIPQTFQAESQPKVFVLVLCLKHSFPGHSLDFLTSFRSLLIYQHPSEAKPSHSITNCTHVELYTSLYFSSERSSPSNIYVYYLPYLFPLPTKKQAF